MNRSFFHAKLENEYHTSENQDRQTEMIKICLFNVSHEHRGKSSQQNISKSNPTIYKKNSTPQPTGVYSRYARLRLDQCSKIN